MTDDQATYVNSRTEGKVRGFFNLMQVNQAVFFAVLLRVWQLMAGAVSLLLIANYFTKELQGYYYLFSSLMTLQAFFELGCTIVVINVASHEWSKLSLSDAGQIEGDPQALSRLKSFAAMLFKMYGVAAVLFSIVVGIGGAWFLSLDSSQSISWRNPWWSLVIFSGFLLWSLPFNALLEGCNQVKQINRFRLVQAIVTNFVVWISLIVLQSLWVAVAATAVRLFCELALFFFSYRKFFDSLWKEKSVAKVGWREELWPLQWRLGLQGIFGYFAFSLYTPVMDRYREGGKELAGQMGMTWMLLFSLQAAALAWVQTRVPQFGMLIAEKEYGKLDRLFGKVTLVSCVMFLTGAGVLLGFLYGFRDFEWKIAERLLSPEIVSVFLLAIFLEHVPRCQSMYLRAHKKDPLWGLNLITHGLTGFAVVWFGSRHGPLGAGLAYLSIVGILVLPMSSIIWKRCKNRWHEAV